MSEQEGFVLWWRDRNKDDNNNLLYISFLFQSTISAGSLYFFALILFFSHSLFSLLLSIYLSQFISRSFFFFIVERRLKIQKRMYCRWDVEEGGLAIWYELGVDALMIIKECYKDKFWKLAKLKARLVSKVN